jgi:multimeric flavodoxin WrbA
MKIVSIIGSPNGLHGNTGLLLSHLLEQAQCAGANTETYSLADYSVQSCRGCYSCAKTGTCPIQDDFEQIKTALIEAEGIIFASPNYMFHISSQMKAFIDRSFSFLYHCRMLTGKYAATIASSGGPYAETVESYLLDILAKMGCWNVGSISITQPQLSDKTEKQKVLQEAADLGRRLVAAIKEQPTFSDQEITQREIHNTLKALILMQKDAWPFEYDYWNKHWSLEED